jgi:uncharacterized membrane protein YqjE
MLELIVGLFIGLLFAVFALMGLSVFVAYLTQAEYVDDREYDLDDD